jgi:hypothetical protein
MESVYTLNGAAMSYPVLYGHPLPLWMHAGFANNMYNVIEFWFLLITF